MPQTAWSTCVASSGSRRSSGLGQMIAGVVMEPYRVGGSWPGSWAFVVDLLYDGLERGRYRDIDAAVDAIRKRN